MKFAKTKKSISSLLIFSMLFSLTFRIPFLSYINSKVFAEERDFYNLVSIIVEEEIYDSIESQVQRYAQDIQGVMENTRVAIFPTPSTSTAYQIASLNESLYLEWYKSVKENIDFDSKLIWTVLVWNIPIPVVFNEKKSSKTMYPYVDFEDKSYVYNHDTKKYEKNEEFQEAFKAEIWHWVINPNSSDEIDKNLIIDYFDKNHDFYTWEWNFKTASWILNWKLDEENPISYEPFVFYYDQEREQNSLNRQKYEWYDTLVENDEDITYHKYSKELAEDTEEKSFWNEKLAINNLAKEVESDTWKSFEWDLTVDPEPISTDTAPEIQTRHITEASSIKFVESFSDASIWTMKKYVHNAWRYNKIWAGVNMDFVPYLISIWDQAWTQTMKAVANAVEDRADDQIKKWISRHIWLPTKIELSTFSASGASFSWSTIDATLLDKTSCGVVYTNFLHWRQWSKITNASECSIYKWSTWWVLVEANRWYNIDNIAADLKLTSTWYLDPAHIWSTVWYWWGCSPLNLDTEASKEWELKLKDCDLTWAIRPLFDIEWSKKLPDDAWDKEPHPILCLDNNYLLTHYNIPKSKSTTDWEGVTTTTYSCEEWVNVPLADPDDTGSSVLTTPAWWSDTWFHHYNPSSVLWWAAIVLCPKSPVITSCDWCTVHWSLDCWRQVFKCSKTWSVTCTKSSGWTITYNVWWGWTSWVNWTCQDSVDRSTCTTGVNWDAASEAIHFDFEKDFVEVYKTLWTEWLLEPYKWWCSWVPCCDTWWDDDDDNGSSGDDDDDDNWWSAFNNNKNCIVCKNWQPKKSFFDSLYYKSLAADDDDSSTTTAEECPAEDVYYVWTWVDWAEWEDKPWCCVMRKIYLDWEVVKAHEIWWASKCTITVNWEKWTYVWNTNVRRPTYRFTKVWSSYWWATKVIADCSGCDDLVPNIVTRDIPDGATRYDWAGWFLWKPISELNWKLAVLLPESYAVNNTCKKENYYYKSITSRVEHESPTNKEAWKQMQNFLTPNLPIDKEREMSFVWNHWTYHTLRYMRPYRNETASERDFDESKVHSDLGNEISVLQWTFYDALIWNDPEDLSWEDKEIYELLKTWEYTWKPLDIAVIFRDEDVWWTKPSEVIEDTWDMKKIQYWHQFASAVYWRNMKTITEKYRFIFENYLSDQYGWNDYKFVLPKNKKLYEVAYIAAPWDHENMHIKVDPKNKDANPFAYVISKNIILETYLSSANNVSEGLWKKWFEHWSSEWTDSSEWLTPLNSWAKDGLDPSIEFDEEDIVHKVLNHKVTTNSWTLSLEFGTDFEKYYYNNKIELKAIVNEIDNTKTNYIDFNLTKLDLLWEDNQTIYNESSSSYNSLEDYEKALKYINFESLDVRVQNKEASYSLTAKIDDIDLYLNASLKSRDSKWNTWTLISSDDLKIEIRWEKISIKSYKLTNEDWLESELGQDSVLVSDESNIYLIDDSQKIISDVESNIYSNSEAPEKMVISLTDYSKDWNDFGITYPISLSIYESDKWLIYEENNINESDLINFKAVTAIQVSGEYKIVIVDDNWYSVRKDLTLMPEVLKSMLVELTPSVIETNRSYSEHKISLLDEFWNLTVWRLYDIDVNINWDWILFYNNDEATLTDNIKIKTVEGYKKIILVSTENEDDNVLEFSVSDDSWEEVLTKIDTVKTEHNIELEAFSPNWSSVMVWWEEREFTLSVKDDDGNTITDFSSEAYIKVNSIFWEILDSTIDIENWEWTFIFKSWTLASEEVEIEFWAEWLNKIDTKTITLLPDAPMKIDITLEKNRLEADENAYMNVDAILRDRYWNLVFNDNETYLMLTIPSNTWWTSPITWANKEDLTYSSYESYQSVQNWKATFKVYWTKYPWRGHFTIWGAWFSWNFIDSNSFDLIWQYPFLWTRLSWISWMLLNWVLTDIWKELYMDNWWWDSETWEWAEFLSKFQLEEDLLENDTYKDLSTTIQTQVLNLWNETNKKTIYWVWENAWNIETFYFWKKDRIDGKKYNSLYTFLIWSEYWDVTKEDNLSSAILYDKWNRWLAITSILNDPYKYEDVISIDTKGSLQNMVESTNSITQDIESEINLDSNNKLSIDIFNESLNTYVWKVYYNFPDSWVDLTSCEENDLKDCINEEKTWIVLKSLDKNYIVNSDSDELTLSNKYWRKSLIITEDWKIDRKTWISLSLNKNNERDYLSLYIKSWDDIIWELAINFEESTVNITRDKTLLASKLNLLKNTLIVYLQTKAYWTRKIWNKVVIFYKDPMASKWELNIFHNDNLDWIENYIKKEWLWWEWRNKILLSFTSWDSVWDSTKRFMSFSLINLWDPVVALKKLKDVFFKDEKEKVFDSTIWKILNKKEVEAFQVFDYNNDSKDDLLLLDKDNYLKILENRDVYTDFVDKWKVAFSIDQWPKRHIQTWDFAWDWYDDIFFVNNESKPYIFNNNKKDFYRTSLEDTFSLSWNIVHTESYDMDNDAISDLIVLDDSWEVNIFYGWGWHSLEYNEWVYYYSGVIQQGDDDIDPTRSENIYYYPLLSDSDSERSWSWKTTFIKNTATSLLGSNPLVLTWYTDWLSLTYDYQDVNGWDLEDNDEIKLKFTIKNNTWAKDNVSVMFKLFDNLEATSELELLTDDKDLFVNKWKNWYDVLIEWFSFSSSEKLEFEQDFNVLFLKPKFTKLNITWDFWVKLSETPTNNWWAIYHDKVTQQEEKDIDTYRYENIPYTPISQWTEIEPDSENLDLEWDIAPSTTDTTFIKSEYDTYLSIERTYDDINDWTLQADDLIDFELKITANANLNDIAIMYNVPNNFSENSELEVATWSSITIKTWGWKWKYSKIIEDFSMSSWEELILNQELKVLPLKYWALQVWLYESWSLWDDLYWDIILKEEDKNNWDKALIYKSTSSRSYTDSEIEPEQNEEKLELPEELEINALDEDWNGMPDYLDAIMTWVLDSSWEVLSSTEMDTTALSSFWVDGFAKIKKDKDWDCIPDYDDKVPAFDESSETFSSDIWCWLWLACDEIDLSDLKYWTNNRQLHPDASKFKDLPVTTKITNIEFIPNSWDLLKFTYEWAIWWDTDRFIMWVCSKNKEKWLVCWFYDGRYVNNNIFHKQWSWVEWKPYAFYLTNSDQTERSQVYLVESWPSSHSTTETYAQCMTRVSNIDGIDKSGKPFTCQRLNPYVSDDLERVCMMNNSSWEYARKGWTDTWFHHYNPDGSAENVPYSVMIFCPDSPNFESCDSDFTYRWMETENRPMFERWLWKTWEISLTCTTTDGDKYSYTVADATKWENWTCKGSSSGSSKTLTLTDYKTAKYWLDAKSPGALQELATKLVSMWYDACAYKEASWKFKDKIIVWGTRYDIIANASYPGQEQWQGGIGFVLGTWYSCWSEPSTSSVWQGEFMWFWKSLDNINSQIDDISETIDDLVEWFSCWFGWCISTPLNWAPLAPWWDPVLLWEPIWDWFLIDEGLPIFSALTWVRIAWKCIPAVWPPIPQDTSCNEVWAGWWMWVKNKGSIVRIFLTPTLTWAMWLAVCLGWPAETAWYPPYEKVNPIITWWNCIVIAYPFFWCDWEDDWDANSMWYPKYDASGEFSTINWNANKDTDKKWKYWSAWSSPIATIWENEEWSMETTVSVDVDAIVSWDFSADVIKIENENIKWFPDFLMDWVDRQIKEVVSKLTDLPTVFIILPDFSWLFDWWWDDFSNGLSDFTDQFQDKNEKENEEKNTKKDELVAQKKDKDCNWDDYISCQWINQQVNNLNSVKNYWVTETVSWLKAVYEFLWNIPLVNVKEENVNVNIPWIDETTANRIVNDRNASIKQRRTEITRVNWDNSVSITSDLQRLINTVEKNIEIIEEYKKTPEKISKLLSIKETRLSQILENIDNVFWIFLEWIPENWKRFKGRVELYILIKAILKSWQLFIDIFNDYDDECHVCRNERQDSFWYIVKLVSMMIPEVPIVVFPKWPDIIIDLHNIKAGITIFLPDFNFNFRPIIPPLLPKLYLPDAAIDIDLPELPELPQIDLPDLPDIPVLPKIELPNLPSPPKIPEIFWNIEIILKIAKLILKIKCLKNNLPFYPEHKAGDQIAFLTERQWYMPTDFIDLSLPKYTYSSIDAIKLTTYVNLEYETDFIISLVEQVTEPLNVFTNDIVNMFDQSIDDFDFRGHSVDVDVDTTNTDVSTGMNNVNIAERYLNNSIYKLAFIVSKKIEDAIIYIEDNKTNTLTNKEFLENINKQLAKKIVTEDVRLDKLREIWKHVSNYSYSKEDKIIEWLVLNTKWKYNTIKDIVNKELDKTKKQKTQVNQLINRDFAENISIWADNDIKVYNERLRKYNYNFVKSAVKLSWVDTNNDNEVTYLKEEWNKIVNNISTWIEDFEERININNNLLAATATPENIDFKTYEKTNFDNLPPSLDSEEKIKDNNLETLSWSYFYNYEWIYISEKGHNYKLFDYLDEFKWDEPNLSIDSDWDWDNDIAYLMNKTLYLKQNLSNTPEKTYLTLPALILESDDNKFYNWDIFYEALNGFNEINISNSYINANFAQPLNDKLNNFRLELYSIIDKVDNLENSSYEPEWIKKHIIDAFADSEELSLYEEEDNYKIRKNLAYIDYVWTAPNTKFTTNKLINIKENLNDNNLVVLTSWKKLYSWDSSFYIEYFTWSSDKIDGIDLDNFTWSVDTIIDKYSNIEFNENINIIWLNWDAYLEVWPENDFENINDILTQEWEVNLSIWDNLYSFDESIDIEYYTKSSSETYKFVIWKGDILTLDQEIKIVWLSWDIYKKWNWIIEYLWQDILNYIWQPILAWAKIEVEWDKEDYTSSSHIDITYYDWSEIEIDLNIVKDYEIYELFDWGWTYSVRTNIENDFYYARVKAFYENVYWTFSKQILLSPQKESDDSEPEINFDETIKIPIKQVKKVELLNYIYENSWIQNIKEIFVDFDLDVDWDWDWDATNDDDNYTNNIKTILSDDDISIEFGPYADVFTKSIWITLKDINDNIWYKELELEVYSPSIEISEINDTIINGSLWEEIEGESISFFRDRNGEIKKVENNQWSSVVFSNESWEFEFDTWVTSSWITLTYSWSKIASVNEQTWKINLLDTDNSTILVNDTDNYPEIVLEYKGNTIFKQYIKLVDNLRIEETDSFENINSEASLYMNLSEPNSYSYYKIPEGVKFNPWAIIIYSVLDENKTGLFKIFIDWKILSLNSNYTIKYSYYWDYIVYELYDENVDKKIAEVLLNPDAKYVIEQ